MNTVTQPVDAAKQTRDQIDMACGRLSEIDSALVLVEDRICDDDLHASGAVAVARRELKAAIDMLQALVHD